jgi:hypothetical protein
MSGVDSDDCGRAADSSRSSSRLENAVTIDTRAHRHAMAAVAGAAHAVNVGEDVVSAATIIDIIVEPSTPAPTAQPQPHDGDDVDTRRR